jgi:cob(I)alamin adenosyltransferase
VSENESTIYTRGGDRGQTSLLTGRRVSKASARVACYGDVDELIAQLAVASELARQHAATQVLQAELEVHQDLAMRAAALLASDDPVRAASLPQLPEGLCARLEAQIDEMTADLAPLTRFILPGGSLLSAQLHVCRTVCRRAERAATGLSEQEPVDPDLLRYFNRLSDWLFTAARYANLQLQSPEQLWNPQGS